MRLFTAIDIPPGVRDNISGLLDRLKPAAKISWSPVANMHITTKFIGEWPEDQLDVIKQTLRGAGSPGAIDISIRGLGWFPNPRNPRVFWAGIEAGPELAELAHKTEAAVYRIGVPNEDREWSPHLTLARIRERVPLDRLRDAIDALPSTDFGSFRASSFALYLSRAGHYTKLEEFALT